MAYSFTRFLDHTQWRTTVGRTPLDEWSTRRTDLYLTTHNTHNRQTFEPTISARKRPQTYALDRAPTGTGDRCAMVYNTSNSGTPSLKGVFLIIMYLLKICVEDLTKLKASVSVYYINKNITQNEEQVSLCSCDYVIRHTCRTFTPVFSRFHCSDVVPILWRPIK